MIGTVRTRGASSLYSSMSAAFDIPMKRGLELTGARLSMDAELDGDQEEAPTSRYSDNRRSAPGCAARRSQLYSKEQYRTPFSPSGPGAFKTRQVVRCGFFSSAAY